MSICWSRTGVRSGTLQTKRPYAILKFGVMVLFAGYAEDNLSALADALEEK